MLPLMLLDAVAAAVVVAVAAVAVSGLASSAFSPSFFWLVQKKLIKIDRQLHKCTYTIQQLSAEKANIRQIYLSNQMSATCFGHDKMY